MTATAEQGTLPGLDLRMIEVQYMAPDPAQPRKAFDAAALDELAASLKTRQTTALKVRPRRTAEAHGVSALVKYVIISGERRWRAAEKAGLTELRAEVCDDYEVAGSVLLEQIMDNLQRVDLGAVEEAAAIRRYAELSKLKTRDLAAQIGKNQMYVSLALGMNQMPAELVKRIEKDAVGADKAEDDGYAITWRHLRQLLRLKDSPDELEEVYERAVGDRSSARELEDDVNRELEWIERQRNAAEQAEKRAAEAKAAGKVPPKSLASAQDAPLSHFSEKEKQDALTKARMTRARKDLIRGSLPEIVGQVGVIAKTIKLPEGLAVIVAGRVGGYDVWQLAERDGMGRKKSGVCTEYTEDIAQLVVPELPGQWADKGARLGAASNGGRWAADDEAGRQWLALAYWLATETAGYDKDLDRQAAAVLAARDSGSKARAAKKAKAKKAQGWDDKNRPADMEIEKPRAGKELPKPLTCAKDGCSKVFHVKQGPGRRPKYCPEHRSR